MNKHWNKEFKEKRTNKKQRKIYNILGQIILETRKTNFSIKHLPKATYFIKVFTEKGQAVKKFIKN
jgi:hypothetical protein